MDVFDLRDQLVTDYAQYVRSFINIRDERIGDTVEQKLQEGALWPEPLIQLNPAFEPGARVPDLVGCQLLQTECRSGFAIKDESTGELIKPLQLYRHQLDAIEAARTGDSYVLTTARAPASRVSMKRLFVVNRRFAFLGHLHLASAPFPEGIEAEGSGGEQPQDDRR